MAKKQTKTGKKITASKKHTTEKKVSGINGPGVSVGPLNKSNEIAGRLNKKRIKKAGMMVSEYPNRSGYYGTSSLPAYYSSYANGRSYTTGGQDIPPYLVQMQQQNGGIIYYPQTLREKYEIYRYFARTDAYCGRALELLSDLPMSKISLSMPKLENQPKELREKIHKVYQYQMDKLRLFDKLRSYIYEYNIHGNAWGFHQWNEKEKLWDSISFLPPEEVTVDYKPFQDRADVEWRPQKLISVIEAYDSSTPYEEGSFEANVIEGTPDDIIKMVKEKGFIKLDTDPNSGSFVYHMARMKAPYQDLGVSLLERVYVPMLMKEHFRYTQLGIASRNMTPKNKININSQESVSQDELDDLRFQIDSSYLDPEFSIVTNYDFTWELIGTENRLLDLTNENEAIENQIFAGLGVTRELLTGEGTYSGTKITVEILNTMFMFTRHLLKDYVENELFKPIADAHGWYDEDKETGIKTYWYPKLTFNRLSIRDNQEVFDSLFQLYQKGSLPIAVIYELFNLNEDELHDQIYEDILTVKDPNFNRVLEEVSTEIGRNLATQTDVTKRVTKYLKLTPMDEQGNITKDLRPDIEVLTVSEREQLNRIDKRDKKTLSQPEMYEFNNKDVEDIANKVVPNIDPNVDGDVLIDSVNKSIDEMLG